MSSEPEDLASMEECLRSLVMYYLDNLMHPNAIFLCERLVACNPREENVLLLATCHFGESSELRAHALLQGCHLPQSRCVDQLAAAGIWGFFKYPFLRYVKNALEAAPHKYQLKVRTAVALRSLS